MKRFIVFSILLLSISGQAQTKIDFGTQVKGSAPSIKYASDFNWKRKPTNPASLSPGTNTITLVPCPLGFYPSTGTGTTYTPTYYVYITGTGTPEADATTLVSGHAGGLNCSVSVTLSNTHSAGYTVSSASGGIKECSEGAKSLSETNGAFTNYFGGFCFIDAAGSPYKIYAPLFFEASFQTVTYAGGAIYCYLTNDDCIKIGQLTSQNATTNVTLDSLVVNAMNGNTTNFPWDAVFVHAQATRLIRTPQIFPSQSNGRFNSYVSVCDDEAFFADFTGIGNASAGLRTDGSGQVILGLGQGDHTHGNTGGCFAVGWLTHIVASMQCGGNGITWLGGNGLRVSDSVIQGFSQYGLRTGNPTGGFNGNTQIDNTYFEAGSCLNPDYVAAGAAGTARNASAGVITQGGTVTARGSTGLAGSIPTFVCSGASGTQIFNYWDIAVQSGAGQGNGQSVPLYAGRTPANCSGTVTVYWPKIIPSEGGTIAHTLMRTVGNAATDVGPYLGNCGGGAVVACGSVVTGLIPSGNAVESFTDDTSVPTTSFSLVSPTFIPYLGFWPGNLVLSATVPNNSTSVPVASVIGELNMNGGNSGGAGVVSVNGQLAPSIFSLKGVGNIIGQMTVQLGGYGVATLLPRTQGGNSETALTKGRLNLIGTNGGIYSGGSAITLVDSNPDKTIMTSTNRPTMDTADVWIGQDNVSPVNRFNVPLAFGTPATISNYINSLPDGINWKERLTASAKIFKVPMQLGSFAQPTCNVSNQGMFNYIAGGAGIKDTVQVCAKDAQDAYAWRTIF